MSADIWAITSYFNPTASHNRRKNYESFRSRLGVPLTTVEMAFDQPFELGPQDADILVQVRSPSILWQKERLLNIALKHVPAQVSNIAWIDCDVIFGNPRWPEEAADALKRAKIVQLFDESFEIFNEALPDEISPVNLVHRGTSLINLVKKGMTSRADLRKPRVAISKPLPGLAWAAQRSLLESFGFYDHFIVGGGDTAIARSIYGWFDDLIPRFLLTPRRASHFKKWAIPFSTATVGSATSLTGSIYHLWHGSLVNRNYNDRQIEFSAFDYDPEKDVALSEQGTWVWASDKPEMHSFVKRYFESRQEDG